MKTSSVLQDFQLLGTSHKYVKMAETREGLMTTEQEKQLDDLIKTGRLELVDGMAIRIVDNKVLNPLLDRLEKKFPGLKEEYVFPIVDAIFEYISEYGDE